MTTNSAVKNILLYPFYKMMNYGYLFYYAINIMYFTLEKGFSISQIMILGSFYMICKLVFQLPVNVLIEKIGLRKSLIIGNFFNFLVVIIYIFAPRIEYFFIAEAFSAFALTIKAITESSILYESLLSEGRIKEFSKLEGKGNGAYYFLDAVTAVTAGYVFMFNHYLPVIFTAIVAFIGFIISVNFREVDKTVEAEKIGSLKEYFEDFKYIMRSDRLKTIFFIVFIFTGIIQVNANLYKSSFVNLEIPSQYVGIIIAIYGIFYGAGSRLYYKIEKKTHNHTLTIFTVLYTILLTVIGLMQILSIDYFIKIGIMVCALFIMAAIAGSYFVAMKKYSNSFSTQHTRTKIMTLYYTFENLGGALILMLSGVLVDKFTNGYTAIIVGLSGLIIMSIIMIYARKRLGLREDQYSPKDINDLKEECHRSGVCDSNLDNDM